MRRQLAAPRLLFCRRFVQTRPSLVTPPQQTKRAGADVLQHACRTSGQRCPIRALPWLITDAREVPAAASPSFSLMWVNHPTAFWRVPVDEPTQRT